MRKIMTILAIFALVASVLPFSMPVEANPGHDVYVANISITNTTPNLPGNISLFATIQAADLPCTNINVTFAYYSGTGQQTKIMSVLEPGPVGNLSGTMVQGYWNSTRVPPDITKNYNIWVTATIAGDTNSSNDTKASVATINWKSPVMNLTNMTGAPTAYKGDAYTMVLTVKNEGNAIFHKVLEIQVHHGMDIVAKTTFDSTVNTIWPGESVMLAVSIPKKTTINFTTGGVHLMAGIDSLTRSLNVTFLDKVPNVTVTSISFDPESYVVKATQNVTITANLQNTGKKAAIDMSVLFWFNTTVIMECDNKVNITAGGGTNTSVCVWHIPAADIMTIYKINVTPDHYNATPHGWMKKDLVVLPTPHFVLGISDLLFEPGTLVAKENVGDSQDLVVSVTVKNTGDLAVMNVHVNLDTGIGKILSNSSVNVSEEGQTVIIFHFKVPTSENDTEIRITATVQKGASLAYLSKNITVPGDIDRPDYNFTEMTVTPKVLQERGLKTTISVKVKNIGDAFGKTITLKFKAGTSDIGNKVLTNIPASGENSTIVNWTIPYTFAIGMVNISVSIDGYTAHKNMSYFIIELCKPVVTVDFARDARGHVQSYSGSADRGKTLTLKVVVTLYNKGCADAKDVRLVIWNSNGLNLANVTGITVPAGKAVNLTLPIKVKGGTSTRLYAMATYDGIYGIVGLDKGLTANSPADDSPTAKVRLPPTGCDTIVIIAAVIVPMVVLSRRKK